MIIILTQCYPPQIGGIENLIENLSIQLSKTYVVKVLADQKSKIDNKINEQLNIQNLTVHRIGGIKFIRRRKKVNELKKLLLSNKVKCIIGDSWKSFELAIDLISSFNIPSICLAHGNELIIKSKQHSLRLSNTLNKVSSIVCNSNFTMNLVKKIGVLNKNIVRIYPGALNCSYLKEEELPKVNGYPIVLTLARLEKRKGHEHILSAISKLKIEFPDILYVVAGTGTELKKLIKKTESLAISNNVNFVGEINNKQKNFLFKQTNLMVMPTVDESKKRSIEGFGISYLEASFYGIPSIASDVGGTNEAVLHNETGLIISSIDELHIVMKDMLLNENRLKELGTNAKKRAEKEFDWEVIVKKYIKLIKSLETSRV